ncbi:hypothetical protein FDI69_gp212 [Rhodococcus phage Trina]|uniref:Uncharacterized protein n=1 Tax=Rhodococcus phage Trina TaxID=2027905 RepID=A0A2D1ADS8_9CAUD|nr:hypothetical protein FDI69_gp212 [Rhodococcus phage Trina]ASZ74974.1 hypothetical protein SEA_TRINA_194 [Rhodococcus phage Trina]
MKNSITPVLKPGVKAYQFDGLNADWFKKTVEALGETYVDIWPGDGSYIEPSVTVYCHYQQESLYANDWLFINDKKQIQVIYGTDYDDWYKST